MQNVRKMFELTTKMLMAMMKMKMASQIFRLQNPDLGLRCRFTGHSGKGKMCQCRGVRTTRWLLAGIGFNIDSGHTRISPVKDPFLSTGVQVPLNLQVKRSPAWTRTSQSLLARAS